MSEWIELKCIKSDGMWDGSNASVEPVSLRVYNITAVAKSSSDSCVISIDNEKGSYYSVAESYEDIMAKVKEAEEPSSYPIVERFTREEYECILEAMKRLVNPSKPTQAIINKLKEILEDE